MTEAGRTARTPALANRGSLEKMRLSGVLSLLGPSSQSFENRPFDQSYPDNLLTAYSSTRVCVRELMQSHLGARAPRGTGLHGESASVYELSSRGNSGVFLAFSIVIQRAVFCVRITPERSPHLAMRIHG